MISNRVTDLLNMYSHYSSLVYEVSDQVLSPISFCIVFFNLHVFFKYVHTVLCSICTYINWVMDPTYLSAEKLSFSGAVIQSGIVGTYPGFCILSAMRFCLSLQGLSSVTS